MRSRMGLVSLLVRWWYLRLEWYLLAEKRLSGRPDCPTLKFRMKAS